MSALAVWQRWGKIPQCLAYRRLTRIIFALFLFSSFLRSVKTSDEVLIMKIGLIKTVEKVS